MRKIKRYRSKARALPWNIRNMDAEPGDLMVDTRGRLFRLRQRRECGTCAAGLLHTVTIKPPSPNLCAEIIDGQVWWVKKESP